LHLKALEHYFLGLYDLPPCFSFSAYIRAIQTRHCVTHILQIDACTWLVLLFQLCLIFPWDLLPPNDDNYVLPDSLCIFAAFTAVLTISALTLHVYLAHALNSLFQHVAGKQGEAMEAVRRLTSQQVPHAGGGVWIALALSIPLGVNLLVLAPEVVHNAAIIQGVWYVDRETFRDAIERTEEMEMLKMNVVSQMQVYMWEHCLSPQDLVVLVRDVAGSSDSFVDVHVLRGILQSIFHLHVTKHKLKTLLQLTCSMKSGSRFNIMGLIALLDAQGHHGSGADLDKFTRFSEENMSWLSNSLQLAGELLESVDQKASGKLKQRGGTRHTTHLLLDLKLRNDLSAVERQLANSTEQLAVCQDELEALDKECTDKITSLERQIGQLGCDKAADEAHFVAALGVKDAHVLTLEGHLTASKHVIQAHVAEIATLKQSIEDLTHTKDQAWTHAARTSYTQLDGDGCTSGEAQLEQRVASLLAELTEASAAHVQLKKEYADSKQSMYARQCALEATNAELTTQVATLQHASTKPTVSEASHHAAVLSLQKELHEARTARPSAGAAPVLTTTTAAVPDGQMQAMTRRLLEKQEQLDAVRSRYTTLEVRFNDLKAAKDAQDKVRRWMIILIGVVICVTLCNQWRYVRYSTCHHRVGCV
ncbi:hypothetical protein DYB38_012316, partial [Aphanomyces astaci]